MATRNDVSIVRPQGGYIAKQCPVRVQLDVLQPGVRVEPDEVALLRMTEGIQFEAAVFRDLELYAIEAGWVFLTPNLDRDEAMRLTVTAMTEGVGVIAGGWLPIDQTGRRTGKPDLLVRHGDGYVPLDVKHHLTLDVSDEGEASISPLDAPFVNRSEVQKGWTLRKRKDDALQLAHYRRMLEACGFAAETGMAGIVGKERVVVWYDLDAAVWQTPASRMAVSAKCVPPWTCTTSSSTSDSTLLPLHISTNKTQRSICSSSPFDVPSAPPVRGETSATSISKRGVGTRA